MQLSRIPHWYSLATDEKALDAALGARVDQAWRHFGKQRMPVIHMSMHGLSSCHGSHACGMEMNNCPDQPIWCFVGNTDAVEWSDAAVAYVTFYHHFFKGREINDCVDRMKAASGDDKFVALLGKKAKAFWSARNGLTSPPQS